MKRSTKFTSIILILFIIIASVIIGRMMIGNHFAKKFGKRPPPGIIVKLVEERLFQNKIETFGTAVPFRTKSYKIEKYEIVEPLIFNRKVKKGQLIAKLKTRNLIAAFEGVMSKRNFSDDINVSESSILINLEDSSSIYVDVNIPEVYSSFVKKNLNVDVKFSGNNDKIYPGIIDSTDSRINVEKRSMAARVKLKNDNLEILPGSLLEISIKYNERVSLSVPDTSIILEGDKTYVYKVSDKNITDKSEIKIGIRANGYVEVISGLQIDEIIVAEGLKKVRPKGKINPIKK
jgi:membrane fusion protein (multidrug efflux system)